MWKVNATSIYQYVNRKLRTWYTASCFFGKAHYIITHVRVYYGKIVGLPTSSHNRAIYKMTSERGSYSKKGKPVKEKCWKINVSSISF